jgi:hypothetical protein
MEFTSWFRYGLSFTRYATCYGAFHRERHLIHIAASRCDRHEPVALRELEHPIMSDEIKLTHGAAFRAAQRIYSEGSIFSRGAQILLTGDEIVRLFMLLSKDYATHAPLVEALEEAISIIESIDGRDNSCDPKTDISDLKAIVARTKGA